MQVNSHFLSRIHENPIIGLGHAVIISQLKIQNNINSGMPAGCNIKDLIYPYANTDSCSSINGINVNYNINIDNYYENETTSNKNSKNSFLKDQHDITLTNKHKLIQNSNTTIE